MSLFRKQQSTTTAPTDRGSQPALAVAPEPKSETLFDGPTVDMAAVYRMGKVLPDELDRVARAEGLLHGLPRKAHTREIVDATFRAFGVDRTQIVGAASKQLETLERFIRFSQEQTQRVLDTGAQRIAELEAEIERCRQAGAQATHEGEERARTVNKEMDKVQRVLDFFGDDADPNANDVVLDDSTGVSKGSVDVASPASKPPSPPPSASKRPATS